MTSPTSSQLSGTQWDHSRSSDRDTKKLDLLGIAFWIIAVTFGAVQAWYSRHHIFSDGISYLDIAKYYLQGNWHAALNSYWSPLYSWLLAMAFLVLRPSGYWEIAMLHVVNFVAYLVSAAGFELCLREVLRLIAGPGRDERLSALTIRAAGYASFLISTLAMVNLDYVSPDMVSTAILLFLAWLLLRVRRGAANAGHYVALGALLGLEYLARAAFSAFIVFYFCLLAAVLLERSRAMRLPWKPAKPLLLTALTAFVVAAPFVIALSVDKGRFTLGDAGKLNYGWEIDGAARSTFWLGEPGDIGHPIHPPTLVLNHPRTFTYVTPVPGSYPPWYEPSYWYQGIQPHLKLAPQLRVLVLSLADFVYLWLRSPVTIPVFALIFAMGLRRWLSRDGILATWFLWLPSLAFIGAFCLVYLDQRYIGGSMLIVWLCLLASVAIPSSRIRHWANLGAQMFAGVATLWVLTAHIWLPALWASSDLRHRRESDWNLQWMIAKAMREAGLRPGDRVAFIGEAMNAYWVSMDQARIVAEVGVRYDRHHDLRRSIDTNYDQIREFWNSSPAVQAQVLDEFRKVGAKFVMVEKLPADLPPAFDKDSWHPLFDANNEHLPHHSEQMPQQQTAYRRLQ